MLKGTSGQKSVQFYSYQFKKNHAPSKSWRKPKIERNILRQYKGDPKGTGKLVAAQDT